MNKQLKLLQRSKVLETLEVEKVKHNLSKIENSNIVMVAYDDATNKFLIGDNSGNLYVATPEYLNSLDVKNTNIENFISNLTKSSIAEHFNKVTIQEVRKMFGDKYFYYWSANDKVYGVRTRLIEQLDNGPDNTKVVELWDRSENVLSNDRGVTGLKEVKFSAELRPAFLTFSENALPTYTRDKNLVVRDPVEIADIMNKDLQNHDYVPNGKKYGYDMKDSNAVLKSYLCTDDLVVLSNIDKREVIDIDPPTVDPDNPDVEYSNNTPFNHNYNMIWSTIRSARLFEEFNDENEDDHSQFANMTRHEQNELVRGLISDDGTRHVDASGLYANIPNLYHTYTTYIEGDRFGEKQIYNNGSVGISIKNEIKYSLDSISGEDCIITKRVYNSITGEVENAKRVYDGKILFSVNNVKDAKVTIKRQFIIPILNNTVCDYDKFEYKLDASGTPISMPIPEEIVEGKVDYSMDQSTFSQGTNGNVAYGIRKIYVNSGNKGVLVDTSTSTGTAVFTPYTTSSDNNTVSIKRVTKILFKNSDNTEFSYETSSNAIGTGEIKYLVSDKVNYSKDSTHYALHTREIHYLSGSTDVLVLTDTATPSISYEIFTLAEGAKTATLKGSSVATFYKIVNGVKDQTKSYNISKSRHITVTSNEITYSRSKINYVNSSTVNCSQTLIAGYTFGGVTITKSITKSASVKHSLYTIEANATSATIKRSFTPVFYTISNGVESTTTKYKNSEVVIDYPKTATVTYSVSSSPTGVSGSEHTATHTRDVYYSENDFTIKVASETYDGVISYKVWNLPEGATSATLKGSSTGIFNTYTNGGKNNTTYSVNKTDHITITTANVEYGTTPATNTGSGNSATRSVTYSANNIKVTIRTDKSINTNRYTVTSHTTGKTGTFTNTVYYGYHPFKNGIEQTDNTYIGTSATTGNITANVTGTIVKYNNDSDKYGRITMTYNGITIKSIEGSDYVDAIYYINESNLFGATMNVSRTVRVIGNLVDSDGSVKNIVSEYFTTSYNKANVSSYITNESSMNNGVDSIKLSPITSNNSWNFSKILNDTSKTEPYLKTINFSTSVTHYTTVHKTKLTAHVTYSLFANIFTGDPGVIINEFSFGDNILIYDSDGTTVFEKNKIKATGSWTDSEFLDYAIIESPEGNYVQHDFKRNFTITSVCDGVVVANPNLSVNSIMMTDGKTNNIISSNFGGKFRKDYSTNEAKYTWDNGKKFATLQAFYSYSLSYDDELKSLNWWLGNNLKMIHIKVKYSIDGTITIHDYYTNEK